MYPAIIIIVEDEPLTVWAMQQYLESKGHRVYPASQISEALAHCKQYRPSLVLLNFRQEDGTDGMTWARYIKDVFRLPVGLVTGARAQDLAASPDFDISYPALPKPFTPRQLNNFIHRLL